jgi:hypothetical protein
MRGRAHWDAILEKPYTCKAQHPPARAAGANRVFFMKTYRNLYPQVYDFENLYLCAHFFRM